ncbi:hypothetical protein [Chamaesiphon sp.]|uniref:hypothetical protein n=1 Tax=Chamaesiphon sp. TaxID=2814140 RepID=UPI003594558C
MLPEKLSLGKVSQQMGIVLPKSGDLSEEAESKATGAVDLQKDSQPPEKNPKIQILLIGLALFSTLGVATMLILWGIGSTTQQAAKKPDSLTATEQSVKSTDEQQKEVADLKTKLVMQQQKEDAAKVSAEREKVNAERAKTLASNPSSLSPSTTAPIATATEAKPIDKMQSSESDKAALAALQQQKQQETSQLAALRQSRQQETSQLAALQQQKQQETSQLASSRQFRQRENLQQLAARAQTANEQRNQGSLRSQRNGNLAKAFTPQPARVARRSAIAKAQSPRILQPAVALNPSTIQQPKLEWEQASTLSNYGGITAPNDPNTTKLTDRPLALAGGNAMSPILRLPVGQVVSGKLVTPFYTLISNGEGIVQNAKALATVTIDRSIEVGSGWHLPIGTAIEFELQIADNGMIQAVSKKVTYGNTEILIPPGAFAITGTDNQPLFAQIREVNGSQLAGADTRAAIFGGAAELGNVLVNSGNSSSVSVGLGTSIVTQNNGSPNIFGALFKGAFNPLANLQVNRANSLANKVEKMSKVGYLLPGTSMRVYVAQAATFQIPTDSTAPQALSSTQNYQPTSIPNIARLDTATTALIVETPIDPMFTQSVINSGGANVALPNPFYISPGQQSSVLPQPLETSPQVPSHLPTIDSSYTTVPTQPRGTSTQLPTQLPIVPNYTVVPTQPPGTATQLPIQPPTVNPNYPTAPIQPIIIQTTQGNYGIK